jgi:hypothetical protein
VDWDFECVEVLAEVWEVLFEGLASPADSAKAWPIDRPTSTAMLNMAFFILIENTAPPR